jgi:L-methionine (R)-S-oxide reductase
MQAATTGFSKTDTFTDLARQLEGLMLGERDGLANCANMAALIYHGLPELNWCGFYFMRHGELVLGPFQGKAACIRIGLGKGVCGTAALRRETIVVPDVHAFPGHIACDAASRSEIVVPLIQKEIVLGVLDLDSPVVDRFDRDDARGLEALVSELVRGSDFLGLVLG